MPDIRQIEVPEQELEAQLLPILRDRVFHVTTRGAYRNIEEEGTVLPSPSNARTWEYDAYFRSIGCVSLCDLRTIDDDQLEHALDAYYFLDPRHGEPDPVFLLLSPDAVGDIISYSDAVADGGPVGGKMLVPHIEAGYPGELPLSAVAEAIFVTVHRSPPDAHLEALTRTRRPD